MPWQKHLKRSSSSFKTHSILYGLLTLETCRIEERIPYDSFLRARWESDMKRFESVTQTTKTQYLYGIISSQRSRKQVKLLLFLGTGLYRGALRCNSLQWNMQQAQHPPVPGHRQVGEKKSFERRQTKRDKYFHTIVKGL